MDTFDAVAYLAVHGWHGRATGGTEINYPCFLDCGETPDSRKRKLYLNSSTGMFDCKRCGSHGGPYLLAKHFGDTLTDNQLHTDQQSTGDPFARRRLLDAATATAVDMLPANPAICDYLTGTVMTSYGLGRGLTPETIVQRRLGFAGGKHWSLTAGLDLTGVDAATLTATGLARADGRDTFTTHITIPYLARGHVEQIRGRNIGPVGSKYLSATGAGVALYNRDSLDDADEVLITEGEFDAMIARQAFAASGDEKLAALAVVALPGTSSWPVDLPGYLTGVRRIWLGLDADDAGRKATVKLADTLGRRARPLALPETHKDWTDWIARGGATGEQIAGLFAAASGRRVFSMADAGRSWRAQRTLSGGLKTGYAGLDSTILPGLLPGQVVVLYAKTGSGKTLLLCNISYNMRRHNILFISLEMTREEIYERLRRIYLFWNPNATDPQVDTGLEHIYICDENRLDENAWADVLDEYQTETGTTPDLVMVDYLGYYARGHAGANRYEQVSNAIMSLKAAAKGNGNPDSRFALITPSQVNRGARAGAPVELDDARDSGGVEETADFVLSLYRPEDALTASDPTAGRGNGRTAPPPPPASAVATGALRLGVLKSRHGGVGREFGLQMDLLTLAIVEMNTAAAHRAADHNNLHRRGHDWNYLRMTETQPRQLRIVT